MASNPDGLRDNRSANLVMLMEVYFKAKLLSKLGIDKNWDINPDWAFQSYFDGKIVSNENKMIDENIWYILLITS